MYKFVKDAKACVECGNCTIYGKIFLKCENIYLLEMDEEFLKINEENINKILEKCYLEVLKIE